MPDRARGALHSCITPKSLQPGNNFPDGNTGTGKDQDGDEIDFLVLLRAPKKVSQLIHLCLRLGT
jgi:inorganic pyrophosphatase